MRAELKGLHSPDAPDDLESFAPADPFDFSVLVQAFVGPEGEEGHESFDFVVLSPAALSTEVGSAEKGFVFLRHRLVLQRWDFALVERAIGDLVRRTTGEDWSSIAQSLSRFGAWEFADYKR